MGEIGKVIDKAGDSVTVSLTRTEACTGCRACTIGMQKQEMLMNAKNYCGANVGDYVSIELKQGVFLKATAIMYAVPLALLVAGFFAGDLLSKLLSLDGISELLSFAAGMLMLLAGYLIINKNEKYFKNREYMPAAVEIAEEVEE